MVIFEGCFLQLKHRRSLKVCRFVIILLQCYIFSTFQDVEKSPDGTLQTGRFGSPLLNFLLHRQKVWQASEGFGEIFVFITVRHDEFETCCCKCVCV